jgi:hypothetical protein
LMNIKLVEDGGQIRIASVKGNLECLRLRNVRLDADLAACKRKRVQR